VRRDGMLVLPDDERFALKEGEVSEKMWVRFRTLGCYPLTGAMESTAQNVAEILEELQADQMSERRGRAIDHDQAGAMELKKQAGYF
jgi:sulfate adenylyltransferase subunit 2